MPLTINKDQMSSPYRVLSHVYLYKYIGYLLHMPLTINKGQMSSPHRALSHVYQYKYIGCVLHMMLTFYKGQVASPHRVLSHKYYWQNLIDIEPEAKFVGPLAMLPRKYWTL